MTILSFSSPPYPSSSNSDSNSKQQQQQKQPLASTSRLPLSPTTTTSTNKVLNSTSKLNATKRGINSNESHNVQQEIEERTRSNKIVVLIEAGGEEDVMAQSQSQEIFSQATTNNGEDISMVVVDSDEDTGTLSKNDQLLSSQNEISLIPLHVEVRLLRTSTMRYDLIRRMLFEHLHSEYDTLLTHSEVNDWREHSTLAQHVDRVWIGECALPSTAVPLHQVNLKIHVYQPSGLPHPFPLTSSSNNNNTSNSDEDSNDNDVPAASILELPSLSLEGVWDSLIYEGDVKGKLLGYIYSTMLFSDAMVDFNIVTWNRVVLLHGPPGTGKTSLCKALAQKLAIRLSNRYEHGKLIEINSHSLFSKWFSESGKLVQKLFAAVTEMVDDESGFVVVLIDEVESLTAARAGAMSGKEPSDALRVVNALLTQLDKLKHRKNCLVMTTSNLSGAIDGAFIDRADIKQYIGLPPAQAVYWILQSCLNEIIRAGLIAPTKLFDWNTIDSFRSTGASEVDRDQKCSLMLYDLAHTCQGMSGRTLRRLPVLAHARYIGMSINSPPMEIWLEAMRKAAVEEGEQMDLVDKPIV